MSVPLNVKGPVQNALAREDWDLLVTDVRMPGLNGIDLLRRARESDPSLPVLMVTAYPTVETAVACMDCHAARPHGFDRKAMIVLTTDAAPYINTPAISAITFSSSRNYQRNDCTTTCH